MSETNAQEPTMEEILASIRRIISEDDAPQAEAPTPPAAPAAAAAPETHAAPAPEPRPPAPAPPEEDVLELTEPVDPPTPAKPEPVMTQKYEETLGDLDVFSSHASSPAPTPPPAAPAFEHEPLVGSYAAEASAGHFGALARSIAMPKEGRTLEDVVREMLKPLLADWLDQHLSGIVEARVQAEVERISRRHDY